MDKRNRLWRRKQQNRVFKARMIYYAACGWEILEADGSLNRHPHWFELARAKWAQVYKRTGTPCSCCMCRGEQYDRRAYTKETSRMIMEAHLDSAYVECNN